MSFARTLFGWFLGRRLPVLDGTVEVTGSDAELVIRRDGWGVPHIDAASERDAWFGLGFCHGQDRTFQLEALARVFRGTLAELVGPDGLAIDRLSRRIGFRRAALRQLEVLDADVRANLVAYASGVNAGAGPGSRRRPHELSLVRGTQTAWDAGDALGMSKLMAFVLSANWDAELTRLLTMRTDGPDAVAALEPGYPTWGPVTLPPGATAGPAADRLAEDIARFLAASAAGGGSNNWAVSASRTATGRPMLANDPHLAATVPPHFYLVHLRCPDWEAAGASLVGAYGIFAGHNEAAAWGVTAGLVDNTDLCVEEIGPDGRSVRRSGGFVRCEVLEETISVKGAAPVVERVVVTPEGPVIGPALEGNPGAISIRATWLEPRPLRGLLDLVKLRTPEDFHGRLRDFPSSSQNVVFATVEGHIGWQLVGEPPRRRAGFGAFPVSGRDPDAGWDDVLPFEDLPRSLDPECGWIATANAKPEAGDDGAFISADFLDGYRLARIGECLAARHNWDLGGMADSQLDVFSIPWRETRDELLRTPATTSRSAGLLRELAGWDGNLVPASSGATVFEFLIAELARTVAASKAPNGTDAVMGRGFTPLIPDGSGGSRLTGHVIRLLRERPDGWLREPWPETISGALERVAERLHNRFGDDRESWAWGRVRPLRFLHPMGARRPLDRVFNLGPLPGFGDGNTVAQAAVRLTDPTDNPGAVPALRMVVDVGKWDLCRWALPGGQSGNPCSPHYDDQLELWQRGRGVPIPWTPEAVTAAARHTLRIRPAEAGVVST